MKWFKHFTSALSDPRMKKLMLRHGVLGYGIYFAVLERVALEVTATRQDYLLEDDLEILANEFKVEEEQLKKILNDCVSLGFFEIEKGKIQCTKLAKNLDTYMHKVKAREVKEKNNSIEEIVVWHRNQVENAISFFSVEPDMDAWYIGIEDLIKSGTAIEDIKKVVTFALSDRFFKTKVIHGGSLRDNFDGIKMAMSKKPKDSTDQRYKEAGIL